MANEMNEYLDQVQDEIKVLREQAGNGPGIRNYQIITDSIKNIVSLLSDACPSAWTILHEKTKAIFEIDGINDNAYTLLANRIVSNGISG